MWSQWNLSLTQELSENYEGLVLSNEPFKMKMSVLADDSFCFDESSKWYEFHKDRIKLH